MGAETEWGQEHQHQLNLTVMLQLVEETGSRCTADLDEVLREWHRLGVEREG
jgi:hypothetical protein